VKPGGRIGFKTSPQDASWSVLDETWAAAGELDVFDTGWLNDHLTDPRQERGGASWEALTLAAALAHHVPGKWIAHGVLSNTFRHPVVLAKAATVLDHVTGGRFIIGLGAGWHVHEHTDFGIELPPMRERVDRFESALEVLRAMFSPAAAGEPGVTRPDPHYPLDAARNEPPPRTEGGPPIWLGLSKPRGRRIAARLADGWIMPGDRAGDVDYFREQRSEMLRELERVGRGEEEFAFGGQAAAGTDPSTRAEALRQARAFVEAGADHVVLGIPASAGPDVLRALATEVAEPLRDSWR
jgi:alkanesulfonate monooxygenase SsuD/methylene tetrahydromethanopterin reductase-like flavin-dependent oxidoreductase (luciferase family)